MALVFTAAGLSFLALVVNSYARADGDAHLHGVALGLGLAALVCWLGGLLVEGCRRK